MKQVKSNIFSKIAKGLNSMGGKNAITATKVAEIMGPVVLANVIDSKVSDVPPVNKLIGLLGFMEEKHQQLLDMTIGQIPVFGQIYKTIAKFGNDVNKALRDIIMPKMNKAAEAGAHWNDPKIYEHLPSYMNKIEISSNFSNTLSLIREDQGSVLVPSLVNFYLLPNISSSGKISSRFFSSMYSVIKAARGLSSTIYSWKTVRDYYQGIVLLHCINATMEKAINASTAVDYTKPEMPDVLLRSLGFDPSDFKLHISEYMDGYNVFRGQVNELGLVEWGFFGDKIEYTKSLLKDSNVKSCTYIHQCYAMPKAITFNTDGHIENVQFYNPLRVDGDITGTESYFTVQKIQDCYDLVLDIFTHNNKMEAFKSDAIGCLATTNAIKLVYKAQNLFKTAKCDELALNALKNADLSINSQCAMTGSEGISYNRYFITFTDASENNPITDSLIGKREKSSNISTVNSVNNFYPKWTQYAQSYSVSNTMSYLDIEDYYDENVTLPKDKADAGYALELLSKHYAKPYGMQKFPSVFELLTDFKTGPEAIILVTVNNQDEVEPLFTESYLTAPDAVTDHSITYWGLIDYMPNIVMGDNTHVWFNLWQADNIGKVNETKMKQVNDYTSMSLLNLDIKVEGAKAQQIQNLIDLYTK